MGGVVEVGRRRAAGFTNAAAHAVPLVSGEGRTARVFHFDKSIPRVKFERAASFVFSQVAVSVVGGRRRTADRRDFVLLVVAARLGGAIGRLAIEIADGIGRPRLRARGCPR